MDIQQLLKLVKQSKVFVLVEHMHIYLAHEKQPDPDAELDCRPETCEFEQCAFWGKCKKLELPVNGSE